MDDSIIDEIQSKISALLPIDKKDVFLFSSTNNDIDVAILIPDNLSRISALEKICEVGIDFSIRIEKFVTLVPIHRGDLKRLKSAFFKNVVASGNFHG